MDGTEFINYFSKVPVMLPYFKGVFSIDTIPKNLKNKSFFVSNLSQHNLPGTHWIGFLCLKKNQKYFVLAAVSIISTALVWLGRIGSWGDRTGFIA